MELVDRVREVSSLVEIASQYTAMKKRGRKWVGLCPFHTEKTPSFTVDEEKQLYHCFGCGAGGDVFSLVMEKESLNFPEALKYLAERYHIPLPERDRADSGQVKLEEKLFKINELALAFFQKNLFESGEGRSALDYLKGRGLSLETVRELGLGYALNSWGALYTHFKNKNVPEQLLEKSGLILRGRKDGDYYDRFRGRVIFPIFSLSGKAVAFGGRTVVEAEPKYLNSPETPIYTKGKVLYGLNWTKNEVRDAAALILVEGYMDFVSLYQAGVRNAAASLGTAFTSYQAAIAKRFAPVVVISYDPDEAGRAAAARAVPICFEKGLHPSVLRLPEGLDPDLFVRKLGGEKFLLLVKRTVSGLKFLVNQAVRSADTAVPEEKARVVRDVVREIEKVADPVARNEYLREASQLLRTSEDTLRQIMGSGGRPVAGRRESVAGLCPAEKRLFQILVQDKNICEELAASSDPAVFQGLRGEQAFGYIMDCSRRRKSWDVSELKNAVPAAVFAELAQALFEKSRPGSPEEARECLQELQRIFLNNRLKEIQRKIVLAEKQGRQEELLGLLYEKQDLTRRILALSEAGQGPGPNSPKEQNRVAR